jgi:hypothetical protein
VSCQFGQSEQLDGSGGAAEPMLSERGESLGGSRGDRFGYKHRATALTSRLQSLETELLTQADSRYRRLPPLTADIGGWYSVGFRRSTN